MMLKNIRVDGLFDRFTHEIPLKLKDRITIIHGPNGFGKTMVLRMIDAFFNQSYLSLAKIPFRELRLDFDNKTVVSVHRKLQKPAGEQPEERATVEFTYSEPRKASQSFTPEPITRPEQLGFPIGMVEEIIPELDQVDRQTWRHRGTGIMFSLEEVLDRYRDELPMKVRYRDLKTPVWLQDIRKAVPVRFINTERLYTAPTRRRRLSPAPTYVSPEPAVHRYSEELGETIRQTLTEYGTLSQSLDRTFPGRLVAEPPLSSVTKEELCKELVDIETKRKQLLEAGLLSQESGSRLEVTAMPNLENIDEAKRGGLAVYARDAKQKLSVFDEVFRKIDLFKNLVNSRFLHKKITVGQSGFQVTSNETQLDPVLLSSGEQHEIVLLYELLFKVSENSIILIDEPELSLHIAWQEAFLEDLGKIAELSRIQALIATHSPQIINDRWDLTVELKGPVA